MTSALMALGQRGSGNEGAPPALRRIVLADDHPLFLRGLREAAQVVCPGARIDEVGTLSDLILIARSEPPIDLVLLDLNLPDAQGFSGLRTMRERYPALPVAIVSAIEDELTINGAIGLGAAGYIPKSVRMSELSDALRQIFEGEVWFPDATGPAGAPPADTLASAGLTPAQMRIISGLRRGLVNKQIAFELGLTEHTVKAHMTKAFRKLGVANRVQAVMLLGPEEYQRTRR